MSVTVFVLQKLVTPFALSIGAVFVINHYQKIKERQEDKETWLTEIQEKQEKLANDLATAINNRYFYLQRVYWALSKKEGYSLQMVDSRWQEYYLVVVDWNKKLLFNRNKIRRLTESTSTLADRFYAVKNDTDLKTLQDYFVKAHTEILACYREAQVCDNKFTLKAKHNCIPTQWSEWPSWERRMKEALEALIQEIDQFMLELHKEFDDYQISGLQAHLHTLYQERKRKRIN